MSEWDENTMRKDFAKNLGYEEDPFDLNLRNPANAEPLTAFEHQDLWGMESRIFGFCFQAVREQTGPYKIFGSLENELVSACVNQHADAYQQTLRAAGKNE